VELLEHGYALEDLRHKNYRKIDPQLRNCIKIHINLILSIESHYLKESTSREYISRRRKNNKGFIHRF